MIRISLCDEELIALKKLRRTQNSNVGERANYVMLSADGLSPPLIAKRLRRNIHTIRKWLKRYQAQGISDLSTIKPPGRTAIKAPVIENKIEDMLSKPPSDYGYTEASWRINLLKDWFAKQNCKACHNTIASVLKKKGFVFKRFSKTLPKNAPSASEKKATIRKMCAEIKADLQDDSEIFFEDESHFSNQPYVDRGWFKKGEKKQ